MSAAALHFDNEPTPSASERTYPAGADDSEGSEPQGVGTPELRQFGSLESLRWSLAGTLPQPQSIACRKVISALIKRAAAGGAALDFLPQEDRDWLLDNLRLLQAALGDAIDSRRGLFRRPHLQGRDGSIRLRTEVIAEAFWSAVNFDFDPDALVAYLDGWQQTQ